MKNINFFNDTISNISKLANERKKEAKEVKDASIGMFYDEDDKLAELKLLTDELKIQIDNHQSRGYDSFVGNMDYHNAIKKWVFKNKKLNCFLGMGYTMGATGALSFSFNSFCTSNNKLLLPSIGWGNYDYLASFYSLKTEKYLLFDSNNKFNMLDFKFKIKQLMEEQNSIEILINDPCHNPTGYSLSLEEWIELSDYLYKISYSIPIVVILDIAYIDYSNYDFSLILEMIGNSINNNLSFLLCFSFSKSFNLYGYRGGEIFYLCDSDKKLKMFQDKLKMFCRCTWSSSNHLLTNTFISLFNETINYLIIEKQIEEFKEILKERSSIFLKECKDINLDVFPYKEGFFVLVKCVHSFVVANKLMEKDIFVVPFKEGVRISIASLSLKKIKGLAKSIKTTMDNI